MLNEDSYLSIHNDYRRAQFSDYVTPVGDSDQFIYMGGSDTWKKTILKQIAIYDHVSCLTLLLV